MCWVNFPIFIINIDSRFKDQNKKQFSRVTEYMLRATLQLSMAMTHGLLHIMSFTTRICHEKFSRKKLFANIHVRKKFLHTMVP